MHRRRDPSPELRRLALDQRGLLTTAQAAATGLGPTGLARMTDQGHWSRLANGLYDTTPGIRSFDKLVWAGVLEAGEPCAVGGRAALQLYGLDVRPNRIEVWVPPDRRPRTTVHAVMRRDKLQRLDRHSGSPPRIAAADAIIDVGQLVSTDAMVGLVTDAIRLRLVDTADLLERISRRQRVRQRRLWESVLADLEGIESTLEYRYRGDVERAHGLPTGTRQASVSTRTRSDVLYEGYGLLVELDGRRGHAPAGAAFRDLRRDNSHAERGFTTLRYGSADVYSQACAVAGQVWQVLHAKGWNRPLSACPRCPSHR